jgi:uncharacterized protein (DUF488 family)
MIFSFGHSTLPQDKALEVLRSADVSVLVDVRSHPGSKWPQFHRENLENWLPDAGVRYEWWPELGGWDKRHLPLASEMAPYGVDLRPYSGMKFPKQRIAKNEEPDARQEFLSAVKPHWTNVGLHDYSWFMSLDEFMSGANKLIQLGKQENVAFMCCEVLWWKCHRSMIADYLAFLGEDVTHLQPKRTLHSKALGNRLERYDLGITEKWKARLNIQAT